MWKLRTLFTASMTSAATIRQAQVPSSWPYKPADFQRIDTTPDSQFYTSPRFVEHIDDRCIAALTEYYKSVLPSKGKILDLASSWISHLPADLEGQVIGLGMNEKELKANKALSSYQVRDLNENPSFDGLIEDGSLDAVICSVSIDYLTQPRAIMGEIARVLKSSGTAHMSFSNRCFPTKVCPSY